MLLETHIYVYIVQICISTVAHYFRPFAEFLVLVV